MDFIFSQRFLRFLWIYIVVLGFIFIFIIPPFQKTDEVSHYYKTVAVATGNLFCQEPVQNLIPQSLYEFPDKMMTKFVNENPQHRFPKGVIALILRENFNAKLVSETASCTLPFIFYFPSAIFLTVPILLKLNPLLIFYLGRLSFYLISLGLFYASLKIIPQKFRLLLLSYLSFPMVIIQMSSYNKEIFHIGFGSLALALFLSLKDRFTKINLVLFIASLILLILPRPQYLPLLLLIFPLFYKENKRNLTIMTGIVVVFLVNSLFFYLPKLQLLNLSTSARLQFLYLKMFPLKFISVLFNSYTNHIEAYYKSLIGTFGSIHYYLDWYVYVFYAIFLLIVIYGYSKKSLPFNLREIYLFLLICFLTTILIFFSLYLYATPVGYPYAVDVQGRYFIMMVPFMIIIMSYLVQKYGYRLIYVGFIIATLFLLKNTYDRYFDYSKSYYYDDSTFINGEMLFINKKVTQKIEINPDKRFLGLRFFVDSESPGMTDLPVIVTFYEKNCKTVLRKTVTASPSPKQNFREAIFNNPLTKKSIICYTLEPFGDATFRDNRYFFVYGDKKTKSLLGLPIYAF